MTLNNNKTTEPTVAISNTISTPTNLKRDRPSTSPEEDDIGFTIKQLRDKCQEDKTAKKLKISNENCDENPDITQKPQKGETIKLIITSHGLTDENTHNAEYFNKNITKKFQIINIKKSFSNSQTLICQTYLKDLATLNEKTNWDLPDKSFTIIIDKKSQHVKSLCINKIFNNDTLIDKQTFKEELKKFPSIILNLRRENNLYIFETTSNSIQHNYTREFQSSDKRI